MGWQLNSRLLALAATALVVTGISSYSYWLAVLIGFGFVHYILAFYYSRHRMLGLARNLDAWLTLISLGGFCALLYYTEFPLIIYFGFHHAFNEAYLRRYREQGKDILARAMAPPLCMLHLAAYFCILRHDRNLGDIPPEALWLFLVVALVICLATWWREANRQGTVAALRSWAPEIALLAMVAGSFYIRIDFLQFVLFHFMLWTFVPIPGLRAKGEGALLQYLVLSLAVMALVYGFMLSVPDGFNRAVGIALGQFYLWSYIHITASLALSDAHPAWIVRTFSQFGPAERSS